MDKPNFKNHALNDDFGEILDNISNLEKGNMGVNKTITIDLKIDEVDEYNTYLYKTESDRDDDYNELEKNI